MQPENPFVQKPLRCLYDKAAGKWWFSAVDICGILTMNDYETARKYWKQFRHKLFQRKNQLVSDCYQLKFPGIDGKHYFTEVLDIREVVYLIQIIPSSKAEPFRLWLADVVASNTNIEALLADAGTEDAGRIEEYRKSSETPYVLQVVTREDIPKSRYDN